MTHCSSQYLTNASMDLSSMKMVTALHRSSSKRGGLFPTDSVEMVSWWTRNFRPPTEGEVTAAAAEGRLDILKILVDSCKQSKTWGYSVSCNIAPVAALQGHLHIIQWAAHNDVPLGDQTSQTAARVGNMKILQWLLRNRCTIAEDAGLHAALGGQLETLKFLMRNLFVVDERACAAAAGNGDLEMLHWLKMNDVPWDASTTATAKNTGNEEAYEWAILNGPEDKD